MAQQRRGKPGRDGARRRAVSCGLAGLVALTLALAGCGGPLAPSADPPGGVTVPGGGGGGGTTSGGDEAAATLIGTWQTTLVIELPGDLQTWITTWRFDADAACRRTRVSESLAEGVPRRTERACTWRTANGQVSVVFTDGEAVAMDFSFAGFSPDRLVLDGFEYQRQP